MRSGNAELKNKFFGVCVKCKNLISRHFAAFQTLMQVNRPENVPLCSIRLPSRLPNVIQRFINLFGSFQEEIAWNAHEITCNGPFLIEKKPRSILSTLQDPTGLPCKCDHGSRPKRMPQPSQVSRWISSGPLQTPVFYGEQFGFFCRLASALVDYVPRFTPAT